MKWLSTIGITFGVLLLLVSGILATRDAEANNRLWIAYQHDVSAGNVELYRVMPDGSAAQHIYTGYLTTRLLQIDHNQIWLSYMQDGSPQQLPQLVIVALDYFGNIQVEYRISHIQGQLPLALPTVFEQNILIQSGHYLYRYDRQTEQLFSVSNSAWGGAIGATEDWTIFKTDNGTTEFLMAMPYAPAEQGNTVSTCQIALPNLGIPGEYEIIQRIDTITWLVRHHHSNNPLRADQVVESDYFEFLTVDDCQLTPLEGLPRFEQFASLFSFPIELDRESIDQLTAEFESVYFAASTETELYYIIGNTLYRYEYATQTHQIVVQDDRVRLNDTTGSMEIYHETAKGEQDSEYLIIRHQIDEMLIVNLQTDTIRPIFLRHDIFSMAINYWNHDHYIFLFSHPMASATDARTSLIRINLATGNQQNIRLTSDPYEPAYLSFPHMDPFHNVGGVNSSSTLLLQLPETPYVLLSGLIVNLKEEAYIELPDDIARFRFNPTPPIHTPRYNPIGLLLAGLILIVQGGGMMMYRS